MKLLRRLMELQHEHGYLREEVLRELSKTERVPLYRLEGLVSFYPHFRRSPPPRQQVAICRDMSCWLAGGPAEADRLRRELAGLPGVEVREVSCLGRCDAAPAASVNDVPVRAPQLGRETLERPPRCGSAAVSPCAIDPYATPAERYGLFRELLRLEPAAAADRVIAALKAAGLRGMGGAGFPTGLKWELVRGQERRPKFVIANADESEPGTFKDRVILHDLPHLVIEALLVAGRVIGAERGILYIRHEYDGERASFERALAEVRSRGLVGSNIAGSDFSFELEVFVSPGGYILGEETALLEALEDRRGEPRNKPPFPGTHGLFGQPTLINNVETLALVPAIVARGPDWWKAQGKRGCAGMKFMAVSGHVERPGVYLVPFGTTVRELIDQAGGVQGGKPLKAFAPGGASSNFLPADRADVPIDFDSLARAGSMLGSGALVVVAEGTDLLALATNVVRFFRNESCGKCVPCRLGTQQAVALLEEVQAGRATRQALDVLPDLAETMSLTSICGLGQVALNPLLSVRRHWPAEGAGRDAT